MTGLHAHDAEHQHTTAQATVHELAAHHPTVQARTVQRTDTGTRTATSATECAAGNTDHHARGDADEADGLGPSRAHRCTTPRTPTTTVTRTATAPTTEVPTGPIPTRRRDRQGPRRAAGPDR